MSGEKRCGCAVCEFAEYTEAILGGARGGGKTNTLRAEVEAGRSVATDSTEHDHEASLSPAARDFAKQADVAPAATCRHCADGGCKPPAPAAEASGEARTPRPGARGGEVGNEEHRHPYRLNHGVLYVRGIAGRRRGLYGSGDVRGIRRRQCHVPLADALARGSGEQ